MTILLTLTSSNSNNLIHGTNSDYLNGNTTNFLNHSSSFVGYVYVKNSILNSETKWTTLRPQYFVDETENIRFNVMFLGDMNKLE